MGEGGDRRTGLGAMRSLNDRAASVLTWLWLKRANSPVMRNRSPLQDRRLLWFPSVCRTGKQGSARTSGACKRRDLNNTVWEGRRDPPCKQHALHRTERAHKLGERRGSFFQFGSESIHTYLCVYNVSELRRAWLGGFCDSEQFQGTKCQTGWPSPRRPHQGTGHLWATCFRSSIRAFLKLTKSQAQEAAREPPGEVTLPRLWTRPPDGMPLPDHVFLPTRAPRIQSYTWEGH